MKTAAAPDNPSSHAQLALAARAFGWLMLAVLASFLFNNVLIVGFGFPAPGAIAEGEALAWPLAAIYALSFALALAWIAATPGRALRRDARIISDFNAYLIRGCFFAVLFTGIADALIAFARVEGLLPYIAGGHLERSLIRPQFIGPWIHGPMVALGFITALFSRSLGFIWLALLIVAAELLIVFSRFVFSYEQALMGDLVRYWYAALFLFSSAYTLLEEGHVRVDVLYAGFDARRKGQVNAAGSILLGMTTCWVIIVVGMGSVNAIVNSPVRNFEVSQTGTAGMYIKYQMAAFLAIFAVTMLIQFVSYLFEAVADARNEPGRRERQPAGH